MKRQAVVLLTTLAVAASLLVVSAPQVRAQQYDPQSIRYQTNARGDIDFVGNTLLTCPTAAAGCTEAQTAGNNAANNQYNMIAVDQDSLGTNSSRATLSLPAGANVLFAGLYWGANSSSGSRNQASFLTPAQPYQTVTATTLDTDGGANYQAFYDATAEVQAAGNGDYGLGNVQANAGSSRFAGWSMIVVYEDPSQPVRNLTVYDGYARVNSANPVQITVSGFLTPVTGPVTAKVTNVVYEGDELYSGDQMLFEGTVLGDGAHPPSNFFNSRISKDGVLYTDKAPNYVDQLGFDIARTDVTGLLGNGQTSATIDYSSQGDWYYVGVVATAIDIFVPDLDTALDKTFVDLNGGTTVPGDVIEYVIRSENLGNDPALNSVISDPIPVGTTFVPGSLQIVDHPDPLLVGTNPTDAPGDGDGGSFDGTSAVFDLGTMDIGDAFEVRFQVTVDDTSGSQQIDNQATLTYQGATLPETYTNTGEASFDVTPSADLVLESKSDSIDPVAAGTTFDYTIVVRNDGPSISEAPVITDPLPAGLTFVSGPCDAGPPVTCTLGDIAANATEAVTISVQADPGAAANTVTNNASVESPTTADPDPSNNSASETTEIVRDTDVSITKVDAADPVFAGTDITYTLQVTNAGPSTSTATTVTDSLPAGTTLVGATADNGGNCAGTALITCDLGDLAPGQVVNITVVVTTDNDLADGTVLTNTASVSTTTPETDATPGNNTAQQETTTNRSASLDLNKTGPTSVNAGELMSYSITATNNGPSISQNAVVVDILPAGFVFDPATSTPSCTLTTPPSEVTCVLGDLAPGAAGAQSVTISAQVPSSELAANAILNDATLSDDAGNVATDNHPVDITRLVDLNIAKSDLIDPVAAGQNLVYEIVVGNDGPSDASGVQITDALPPEVSLVSATFIPATDGSCSGATCVPTDPVHGAGVLAAGATATVQIEVAVPPDLPPGTTLNNTATITSVEDPAGTSASETTNSFNEINLTIGKVATPNPVIAGETVTYTITFNNAGPSDAQLPEIVDTLPAEVVFSTAAFVPASDGSCSHDGSGSGGAVTCIPNSLTAGQTVTVTVVGTVLASTADGADIINNVAGSAQDPADPTARISVLGDAVINVQREADLVANKTVSPDPVRAGELVTYTIDVTNAGPSDASGIVALDPLPSGLQVQTPLPVGCTDNAGSINCDVGVLAAGSGTSIELVAQVASSADPGVDLFPNTVTVQANEPDPDPSNNASTVTVDVDTDVALSMTKTDNIDPVVAGETVVYTLEVSNAGPSDADLVTITDTPPLGMTFDPGASSSNCVLTTPTITCTIATIAAGGTAAVNLAFTVDADAAEGTVTNNAVVVSDEDPLGTSASEETTIETRADLAIVKTTDPNPVLPGQTLTYTIEISNNGPSTAVAVEAADTLPSDLSFVSVSDAACSHDGAAVGGAISCAFGDLAPGTSTTITVVTTVDPAATSDLTNSASVSSPTADPNLDNNASAVTTSVLPQADVSITKSDSADPITAGLGLGYEVVASNAGPAAASNVVVTDTLPDSVSFVSAPGCSHSGEPFGGTVTCSVGVLAPGGDATFTISVNVDPNTTSTVATNRATVTTDTLDNNAGNDEAVENTIIESTADLSLSKSVSPNPVLAGEQATYVLAITNGGPSSAQAVNINDQLPTGMSFVSSSVVNGPATCTGTPGDGGSVACGFGTLTPGESRSVEILVDVLTSASGTLTNNAVASSPTDPNPPSASAPLTVLTSADLVMTEKTDNVDPAIAGQGLVWTLGVRNDGPSDAVNSTITDTLPAGVTFDASTSTPGCTFAGGVVTCPTGTLAPGDTASVEIGVTVDPATTGVVDNTGASVQSDTDDPDTTNNSQSESTTIETQAQVTAIKSASPDPVAAGELLTYEIEVTNEGPSTAPDVELTDPLPSGTTFSSASTGCAESSPGVVTCSLGTMSVGQTETVTIVVLTSADLADGEALANTATISWTGGGPTSAPTSSQVVRSADLSITKSDRQDPVAAGTDIEWDVAVSNAGPSDASNVVITDTLPSGTVFDPTRSSPECNQSGPAIVCNLTMVPAGTTVDLVIVATVDSIVSPGTTLTNQIEVSANEPDPNAANNTASEDTSVTQVNDLSLIKSGDPNPVTAGEFLSWTITITNDGPSNASGVEISDVLPAGATFVPFAPSVVPSSDPSCSAGVTCVLPAIAAGDSVEVTIVAEIDPSAVVGSTILNEAEISAFDGTDPNPDNNSDDESTTIQRSAGMVLAKTADQGSGVAGQPISYVLRLQNDGPSVGSGVEIVDTIPAGTSFSSFAVLPTGEPASCSESAGTVTCTPDAAGATLGVDEFIEVRVVVDTDSGLADGATVTNNAVARSTDTPPDFDEVEAQASTPITRSADLLLDKSADPAEVLAGETVTYTITVSNLGPSDASDIVVDDVLPVGVSFVSSADGCAANGSAAVQCSVASLPAGTIADFTFVAAVASDYVAGQSFDNNAVVDANEPDPDTTNNSDAATTLVNRQADLSMTKSDGGVTVTAGEAVAYTIEVTNNGPSQASNVQITDPVPAGATFDADGSTSSCIESGGVVTCDVAATIDVGSAAAVVVSFLVDDDAANGSAISNTAQASASEPDPSPTEASDTTPVATSADVSISKDAIDSMAVAGTNLDWGLQVSNAGPSVARDVVVTDTLAAGLTGVSATPSGECTTTATQFTCTFAVIEVGESIGILLTTAVDPDQTDPVTNAASVASSTSDPDASNNQSTTVSVPTGLVSDVSISKTSAPDPVVPGQPITYTLVVTNNGPSSVTGARVSDTTPAEAVEPVASCTDVPAGGTCTDTTIFPETSFLLDLPAGTSATIEIVATVDPDVVDPFVNTAFVSVPPEVLDPVPDNNVNDDDNNANPTVITDLEITKTSSPSPAVAGEAIQYTLEVTNNGPATAAMASVADSIPEEILNPTASCVVDPGEGTCSVSVVGGTLSGQFSLDPGTSLTITIDGQVDPAASATISNTASVSPAAGATDPDDSNNSATDFNNPDRSADVSVTKSANQATATAGETALWTVTVTNDGPSTADDVVVRELLPPGVTLVAEPAGCSAGVCDVGTLAVGESADLVFEGLIDSSLTEPVINRAEVSSTTPDPDLGNNQAESTAVELDVVTDLSLQKTSAPDPIVAGGALTYTLVVTNDGPSDAVDARVLDSVPAEFLNPVASCASVPATASCTATSGADTEFVVSLPAGESLTVTIAGTVDASFTGTLENVAVVEAGAGATDPTPSNNAGVNVNPSTGSADLQITKSVSTPRPRVGTAVTWELVVTNAGPSTVSGARVLDSLPAGLTDTIWSCAVDSGVASCGTASGTGDVDLALDLTVGSVVVIRIVGFVSVDARDLTNTATVSPPAGFVDPNPGNNQASVGASAVPESTGGTTTRPPDAPSFVPIAATTSPPPSTPAAPAPPLAVTGTDARTTTLTSILLMIAGACMVAAGNRRRRLLSS